MTGGLFNRVCRVANGRMLRRKLLVGLSSSALLGSGGCLSALENIGGDDEPELIDEKKVVDETIISTTSYTVYLSEGDKLIVSLEDEGRVGAMVTVYDPSGERVEQAEEIQDTTVTYIAEEAGTHEVSVIPDDTVEIKLVIESYAG